MTSTTIAVIVFICTIGLFLTILGLWNVYQQSPAAQTQRRLREINTPTRDTARTASILKANPYSSQLDDETSSAVNRMQRTIVQAGINLSLGALIALACGIGSAAGMMTFLFTLRWIAAAIVFGLCLPVPFLAVLLKRRARAKAFESQLPGAMEMMARALRAGHSFASSLQMVGDEMPDPIAVEFRATYQEQQLGIPLETCLTHLCNRVACGDLRFFSLSILIQRETGGDLAEILDKSAYVIRERFRILGQVKALTAEGRLSGWVLVALPLVMFAVINVINPAYAALLLETRMGHFMLIFAGIMQTAGAVAIKRIVTIKV